MPAICFPAIFERFQIHYIISCGRDDIKTEFYLVNTNTSWLKQNFKFIQAFYAGSEWLHLPFCQVRPPNVYHVLCPGRFQIYWAALDLKITFEGKLRKNEEASKFFREEGILSIDENMLWPEAWKVELSIRDLTPNNFNVYAEYYEHGFKAEEIATLERDIGLIEAIGDAFKHMAALAKEMKDNGKDALSAIGGEVNKLGNAIKDLGGTMKSD
jgi:hypothetical protein